MRHKYNINQIPNKLHLQMIKSLFHAYSPDQFVIWVLLMSVPWVFVHRVHYKSIFSYQCTNYP